MRSRDEVIDEDDFFKDTRMSFGDHIEVLRKHLWAAIKGLVFCLVIGFVLDGIGDSVGIRAIGIGRPLMSIIEAPVKQALIDFYDKRREKFIADAKNGIDPAATQAAEPKSIRVRYPRQEIAKIRDVKPDDVKEDYLDVDALMNPIDLQGATSGIDVRIHPRELTTLSAQEPFLIYMKVSLVAGVVIASPWIFWQIWSFIAAGLYPHEKKYVHSYLPLSLGLFVVGVVFCQFVVMPKAVAALLWFNDYIGVTPDLRLSEWMSLAILMPLMFGISFQTPLVMLFLERIGICDVPRYRAWRRYAYFGLAVFAMIVVPSPDPMSMILLMVPMWLLYEFGIILCLFSPGGRRRDLDDLDVPSSEDLVEV
jgi:sec-independent protein translocase protein TatC